MPCARARSKKRALHGPNSENDWDGSGTFQIAPESVAQSSSRSCCAGARAHASRRHAYWGHRGNRPWRAPHYPRRGRDPRRSEQSLRIFQERGLSPRINDVRAFANANQVLLLRHLPSGVDVDVSLAWLPFELEAIDASDKLLIGGVRVPVARPEDLVIYKAVAWRPQDQQDVERLLNLHGERMDLARVRRIVAELAAALEEPERVVELERVIERALK